MTAVELDSSAHKSSVAFAGRLACVTRAEASRWSANDLMQSASPPQPRNCADERGLFFAFSQKLGIRVRTRFSRCVTYVLQPLSPAVRMILCVGYGFDLVSSSMSPVLFGAASARSP
jgi:hypothetical protein